MTSRRTFLKYTASGLLTLFGFDRLSGVSKAIAAMPGGSLRPEHVEKFRTPLFIPPAMPAAGKKVIENGRRADYYEISVKQFSQQILPRGFPPTTVWGYGPAFRGGKRHSFAHHAPGFTIEAKWQDPIVVKWINGLKDDTTGSFLPSLLPVDQTLHWANPPGGKKHRDTRPSFESAPGPYRGPVPIVTHLHGATGVAAHSDGYPEAWYLPAAADIPAGYAVTGSRYQSFNRDANPHARGWEPGSATFTYPNLQTSTLWYRDQALGMTRTNVYAGLAGFYFIRSGPGGDGAIKDARNGRRAVLPSAISAHVPKHLPQHRNIREIPLVIQDRSFNVDGSLFYPRTRAFFDGTTGSYIRDSDIPPIWNPEFFANMIVVNGNTWPFHPVEQQRYRFRLLNACNSRFLILDFGGIPGVKVWMIGGDSSFLPTPVNMTTANANRILMGPSERADVIVDFTGVPPGRHVLKNVGPDEPFGGGEPGVDFQMANPRSTGLIMQFRVIPGEDKDRSTPPQYLLLPQTSPLPRETFARRIALMGKGSSSFEERPGETFVRRLALLEKKSSSFRESSAEALLGIVLGDPKAGPARYSAREWEHPVTQNPRVGTAEIWEFYNATEDAHPVHVHAVSFELFNRQAILVDAEKGTVRLKPGSHPVLPELWELGLKDTVIAYPGQVTRVCMTFTTEGQYIWHCHILEREDNQMMLPYRVSRAKQRKR